MSTVYTRRNWRARTTAASIGVLATCAVAVPAAAAPDYSATGGATPTAEAKPAKKAKKKARASAVKVPAVLKRIAECESGSNPRAVSANGLYRGKYQFHRSTWRSMGGSGDPAKASENEQDRRAVRLYKQQGTAPWPVCGR